MPTIPFATGATKMSVRVYSAYAGVRVHLKVEQSGRPDFNSEVDACTTLTNAWETLIFDFGPAGMHFVPSGPCPGGYQTDPNKPGYLPTAQLDVSKTYNKVNIFFDYGLGDAGYDAMPGTSHLLLRRSEVHRQLSRAGACARLACHRRKQP